MSDRPTLSLIVPTKDRPQYAGPCIRSLLRIEGSDLEVVVSDNSSDERTADALRGLLGDRRLKYARTHETLNIEQNFERALRASSGRYVGFLGDDDGVNREILDAVRWAGSNDLDGVVGRRLMSYLWPDVRLRLYGHRFSSALRLRPFTGTIHFPNPSDELLRVASRGAIDFGRLPKAYHGVVDRQRLDEVHARAGTFFPGPTPDMASAAALATVVERYAFLDYPLFVSGTGKVSGGGAGATRRHDWSLDSVPWFPRRAIDRWSNATPRIAVGQTLWAEGVLQASRAMGRSDVVEAFNYGALYGRCAAFHPHHREPIADALRRFTEDGGAWWTSRVAAIGSYLRSCAERVGSLANNLATCSRLGGTKLIGGLPDIDAAMQALDDELRRRPPSLRHRLSSVAGPSLARAP